MRMGIICECGHEMLLDYATDVGNKYKCPKCKKSYALTNINGKIKEREILKNEKNSKFNTNVNH